MEEPQGSRVANRCADTIDEAREKVDIGLCRIGSETRTLPGLFRHAGFEL